MLHFIPAYVRADSITWAD